MNFTLGLAKRLQFEMNGEETVERRGRGEQGLVGKDTAEGKKDGRKVRIRRANFDDLNAIMDINDNVYDGLDYMPALFYTFMHSKLHVIYVHEEDGKLVSLYNCRFHPDRDDLVSGMSGRVRPSYQGRGLGTSDTTPLRVHVFREHPQITRYVGVTMYTPIIAAKMKKWKMLYHWNYLVYKLADRQWLNRFTRIRQRAPGAISPFSLSYTNGIEWLERSDQLVRFVSKYVVDLFPIGSNWMPTPANRSGLRYMLSVPKVFISLDAESPIDNSCPASQMPSTGHLLAADRGHQSSKGKGKEGDITGLSYSTVIQCKYGLRIDIYFYGDSEMIFMSHVYSHLLHYVNNTSDNDRFGVVLQFPLTIDSKNVEERLKEEMGHRFDKDFYVVTKAVQYVAEYPQAKL